MVALLSLSQCVIACPMKSGEALDDNTGIHRHGCPDRFDTSPDTIFLINIKLSCFLYRSRTGDLVASAIIFSYLPTWPLSSFGDHTFLQKTSHQQGMWIIPGFIFSHTIKSLSYQYWLFWNQLTRRIMGKMNRHQTKPYKSRFQYSRCFILYQLFKTAYLYIFLQHCPCIHVNISLPPGAFHLCWDSEHANAMFLSDIMGSAQNGWHFAQTTFSTPFVRSKILHFDFIFNERSELTKCQHWSRKWRDDK